MDLFNNIIKTTDNSQIKENSKIINLHENFNQELIIFKIKIMLPILDYIVLL